MTTIVAAALLLTAGCTPGADPTPPSNDPTPPPMSAIVAGGLDDDVLLGVAVAGDGGIIAVGDTSSTDGDFPPSHGQTDALIAKYGPGSTQQWAKTTGGSGYDGFTGVAVASDGSIIAVGSASSTDGDLPPSHGKIDALIVKYSADGTRQWAKTTGGSDDDMFTGVAVAGDGSIIAVGATSSKDGDLPPSHGLGDALIVKFSSDGTQQWAKSSGGSDDDMFRGVAVAGDGSIIAVGETPSTDGDLQPSHGKIDALIVKFSPDGTQQWAKTTGGSDYDCFGGVAVAGDGSIITAGYTGSTDGDFPPIQGDFDAVIAKYSPDGTRQWAKTAGGTTSDTLGPVVGTSGGSIIAAGYTTSTDGDFPPSHGKDDALIVVLSPDA